MLHCVSPKGILYGGIAARLVGIKSVVLAISGMGFAFTQSKRNSILRKTIASIYRGIFTYALRHKNVRVIVQNKDDYKAILDNQSVDASRINLIPGSGVELERFIHFPIDKKEPIVILPARMVEDKGILEFVDAVFL